MPYLQEVFKWDSDITPGLVWGSRSDLSPERDSNPRLLVYETSALTRLSYRGAECSIDKQVKG